MNTVETILSPALFPSRTSPVGHTSVTVDILRATTSLCAAFQAGAAEVIPLSSLDELSSYRALGYTLAAERGGSKVADAECGNSPTEYLSMNLNGRRLAYSTTNGTVAILAAAQAGRTLVGAFANISALADRLVSEANDVVVLCSGWLNSASLEDTLFCGALASRLLVSGRFQPSDDATAIAIRLWLLAHDDPYAFCADATHVQRLQRMGCDRDIRFAFQLDTCPVVPCFSDGRLVAL